MLFFSSLHLKARWRWAIGWLAVSTLCYGAGFPLGFALGGTLLWGWVVAGIGSVCTGAGFNNTGVCVARFACSGAPGAGPNGLS